jgi:hypothetical protein
MAAQQSIDTEALHAALYKLECHYEELAEATPLRDLDETRTGAIARQSCYTDFGADLNALIKEFWSHG